MGLNKSAQVKFGFYSIIITVLLLAFVAAEVQQADQNSPQAGQPTQQQEAQPPPEPAIDQNTPLQGTNGEPVTQIELPAIKIISPVFGETVSGTGVVITVISPIEKITSAFFEAGGIKKDLSAENNFSGDFNSQELLDGNYELKATACIGENCQSDAVPITVSNQQSKAQEEPPAGPQNFVFLAGSNVFSALTVFDTNNGIAASGTENVKVLAGKYKVQVDFPEELVSKIVLESADMQSDMNVTEIETINDLNSITAPDKSFEWLYFTTIKTNAPFDSGQVSFSPAGKQDALFSCSDWDFAENKCRKDFEKFLGVTQSTVEETLPSQNAAFGFAKYFPETAPDFNASQFDENNLKSQKEKSKKFGKKLLKMKKKALNFAANDPPEIELSITDEKGNASEANVQAFLEMPDGTRVKIDANSITEPETGKFKIKAKKPRSFRAGVYKVIARVESTDPKTNGVTVVEETLEFEWGLIAVNTRKSIYKPGETAEFEIVVLDKESFGVAGAAVTMAVTSPSGAAAILSTQNGLVQEANNKGIYLTSMGIAEEGTYNVIVEAKAPHIDTSIQTTFDARQNYAFDIVRFTPTKIDPAVQPTNVQIAIVSLEGNKLVNVREFVSKEFDVSSKITVFEKNSEGEEIAKTIDDPKVSVFENADEKIIEWKNVELAGNETLQVTYTYIVPDKKPWLYNLGPIEIAQENGESFFEARSWMVAVDANPTTKFFLRNSTEYLSGEPAPNATNDGNLLRNDWVIRGMNDSAGTTPQTRANTSFTSTSDGGITVGSFVSPPLVLQTVSSGTWIFKGDYNESSSNDDLHMQVYLYRWVASTDVNGTIIVSPTNLINEFGTSGVTSRALGVSGNAVTFNRGDKLVYEAEFLGASPSTALGTLRFGDSTNDANVTTPASIRIAGDLNTGIVSPANNSSRVINTAFDVNALGSCANYSCGDTNVVLKYCVNPSAGCSTLYDMNTVSSSPLYISTGAASRRDDMLASSDINYFVFTITGTIANTYTVRSSIDSNWSTDINTSKLTKADLNVTIASTANLAFAASLPSSGCTDGKGRFLGQGAGACQRGYFQTTDLSGAADENKVDAEGQTSTIPLFVYDNQSTTTSDINVTMDLNANPALTLRLKVSQNYNNWENTCGDNPVSGCVRITTTTKNIGKATYTAGTQDLNLFAWADFLAAAVGSNDRNVNHTSISP